MLKKISNLLFILLIIVHSVNAQQRSDAEIKTALIYNICNDLTWQNSYHRDTFLIGVYGNDPLMLATLKEMESQLIHGKMVSIVPFNQLQDIRNTDVLYLNYISNYDIERVFRLISNTNTLLITDRNDQKREIMINFFHDERNTVKFEINRRNIEEENIAISPNLILLGGTELDVRDLYLETEKELIEEQKKTLEIEKILSIKQEELRKLNLDYEQLQKQTITKSKEITQLSESIAEKEQTLTNQELTIDRQKALIQFQNDSISRSRANFRQLSNNINELKTEYKQQVDINQEKEAAIDNLDSLIKSKQLDLDKQTKQIEEHKAVITAQKRTLFLSFGVGILLVLMIGLIIYAYRQKRRMNAKLEASNEELSNTNDKLYHQREELSLALSELQDTQERLIESEKMATVGSMAAGVAHEINNPLNFIHGGIHAIHEQLEEEHPEILPSLEAFINAIETGIDRAVNIVKSLNTFSRKSESLDEDCPIVKIIENCLIILESNLKNKVEVQKQFKLTDDKIKGNVGKLHQVFINLFTNAEHAIDKNGIINIDVRGRNENSIEIKVTDNGKGIPLDLQEKIFEPFFTTKKAGEGTGLGLAIVNNIIKEHKGTVLLESEVDKGTSITITLPRELA